MIKSNEEINIKNLSEEKNLALFDTIKNIKQTFGNESIMLLGKNNCKYVECIPTGSIGLDKALGIGGVPKGRVVEIYGPESSGKTTIALQIAAQCQAAGGTVAVIDAEHALDPKYARNIGVSTDELIISQPDNGEMALDIAEALIRSAAVDLLIIDSVAALTPRAEIEGNMGDQVIGLQARLMSQALRKLTALISKTGCTVIFINQLRDKIGNIFGSSEQTPGGRALKFFSSVRLDVRRKEVIKIQDNAVGSRINIKVVKNKVAAPYKNAELVIMYDEGIDKIGEIIDLGVLNGSIVKSGGWLSFQGKILGQGRENVKEYLRNDVETRMEIEATLMERAGTMVEQG